MDSPGTDGPGRDDNDEPDRRRSDARGNSPGSSSRPADDDAAGFTVGFTVGPPTAGGADESQPEVNVPSEEAASFGIDPDHGVKADVPLADLGLDVPLGDQVVPVKTVLGLGLKGWAAVGAFVLTATVGGGVLANQDGEGTEPGTAEVTTPVAESGGGFGGEVGGEAGETEGGDGAYIEPDPIAEAAIGDCYYVYGSDVDAQIEWTSCDADTFEVVDIAEGTTDLSSCDYVEDADQAVTSTAASRVLCMSYIAMYGDDAYHAQPGECVYGPNEAGMAWNVIGCEAGAFTVLDVLEGTTDTSGCESGGYGLQWFTYTASEPEFDRVLCLQIVYPDDIGYAEQYTCMVMYEDDSFEFADSCDSANVRVTGRTNEYDASWWCDGYGWTTWTNEDFPEHAYTVCWEWY